MRAPGFDSLLSLPWCESLHQSYPSISNSQIAADQRQTDNGNVFGDFNCLADTSDSDPLDILDIDIDFSKFMQSQEIMI